jgi:predicted AlkP superfamily pyrophosphatase or phosphodiesterase
VATGIVGRGLPIAAGVQLLREDVQMKVVGERMITSIAPTVCAILCVPAPAEAMERPIDVVASDLEGCRRVAILAPDGLGDYPFRLWRSEMPFLHSLHGKHSLRLRTVDPPITPVCFASIVSGALPSTHAVHSYRDDIRCETVFTVLRAAGHRSAGVGRVGYSGAELLGRHADISGRGPEEEKDEGVERLAREIAERELPEFMIVQFGETDDGLHQYGPSSPKVIPTLRKTDERLRRLAQRLRDLGYGVLIHADHGMHDVLRNAGNGDDPNFDLHESDKLPGTHDQVDLDEDSLVACTWIRCD